MASSVEFERDEFETLTTIGSIVQDAVPFPIAYEVVDDGDGRQHLEIWIDEVGS